MSKNYDTSWAELRIHYRKNVNRVLNDIRNGTVSELDLDKLHNFCQDCFMLMAKVPEAVWRKAEKDAEIAGLLKEIEEENDPA
jgi:hypothetical protein